MPAAVSHVDLPELERAAVLLGDQDGDLAWLRKVTQGQSASPVHLGNFKEYCRVVSTCHGLPLIAALAPSVSGAFTPAVKASKEVCWADHLQPHFCCFSNICSIIPKSPSSVCSAQNFGSYVKSFFIKMLSLTTARPPVSSLMVL